MATFPRPENEKKRIRALKNYEILDSISEVEYDRITRLATIICDVPISMITLLDNKRQWFKSKCGLDLEETSRELSFCNYTILQNDLFVIEDTFDDPRFNTNPFVTDSDGGIRFYAGYPLTDPDGYNLGTLCVADQKPNKLNDKQKEALRLLSLDVIQLIVDRRLKEELKNFEKLFLLSDDLICVSDKDGGIIKINPAYHKLLGWDIELLMQTKLNELVHPEDLAFTLTELASLKEDTTTVNFEHRLKTVTGDYKILQWTVTIETGTNNLFGVGRDITERRLLEKEKKTADIEIQRSRAILSSFVAYTPAAVAMLDRDMNYVTASNRWIEDYCLNNKDIKGISYYEYFPSISIENKERHQRVLKGEIARKDEDIVPESPKGKKKYVTWEMRPWFETADEIGGMMVFTQDITAMVHQREELNLAKIAAEEANSSKSEFLANMSHEIRTPLNGIIGFTDLVLKTNLSDNQHQYLSIVNQSANTLMGIIDDILDFSKIEAGKLELNAEECDLQEISQQAIDIISFQVQEKNLEVRLNLPFNLPRRTWVDTIRLKQILVNLLGNATKFTERGEIELKIDVLEDRGDHFLFRFSVTDTGIGIRAEKQEVIFEAFSQEDGSTSKKYGGTGLGLAITNQLLALMDTRLQLYSTIGEGSLFFFDIVLKVADKESALADDLYSEKAAVKIEENGKQVTADRITILIADDNPVNVLLAKTIVKRAAENAVIIEAQNGLEVLDYCEAVMPDLILMDVQMPEMNGYEATIAIRNREKGHVPIIAVTAGNVKNERERCFEAGMDDFVVKPVIEETIVMVLKKWLQ